MQWYAAHVILYVRFKEGQQEHFPVWENVLLVRADTEDAARSRAEVLARQEEGDSDGSFRWDERPSTWVFAGIRKLVKCDSNPDAPGDGTEITYSEMSLATEEDVLNLASGRPTRIDEYD